MILTITMKTPSKALVKFILFIPVALVVGVLLMPEQAFLQAQAQAQEQAGPTAQEVPAKEKPAAVVPLDQHSMRSQDQITSGTALINSAPLEDGEIDFDLLRTTVLNRTPPPVFDPKLDAYEGKRVKIRAFMTPFDSLTNFQTFMAFPNATGCNFCAPPSPLEVVLIRLNDPDQKFIPEPIEIEGTLSLWRKDKTDNAHKSFLYVMNNATVKVLSYE